MIQICGCGLLKQSRAGVTDRDGVRYCNACGLPTEIPPDDVARVARSTSVIPSAQITTLGFLPGFRVVKALGVVSELAASSGWTAGWKGNNALFEAMAALNRSAAILGANAIIGLHSSTFGAHGGITSGLGGDAVGVLLLGTAVTVEPQAESADSTPQEPTT